MSSYKQIKIKFLDFFEEIIHKCKVTISCDKLCMIYMIFSFINMLNCGLIAISNIPDNEFAQFIYKSLSYTNYQMIFQLYGITKGNLVYVVFSMHILIVILYICIYHFSCSKYKSSFFYRFLCQKLGKIQQIYIWLFLFPDAWIHIRNILKYKEDISKFIISIIGIIFTIFYSLFCEYTRIEIGFFSKNVLNCKISSVYGLIIFVNLTTALINTLSLSIQIPELSLVWNLLMSYLLIRNYLNDLPFFNKNLSKCYAILVFNYPIWIIMFYSKFEDIIGTTFSFSLILTTLMVSFCALNIRKYRIDRILFFLEMDEMSSAEFDFFIMKVALQLQRSDTEHYSRIKSSFILAIFVNKHRLTCQSENCLCRDTLTLNLNPNNYAELLDQTLYSTIYKELFMNLIHESFNRKLSKSQKSKNLLRLELSHIGFLIEQYGKPLTAYRLITLKQKEQQTTIIYKILYSNTKMMLMDQIETVNNTYKIKFGCVFQFFDKFNELKMKLHTNTGCLIKIFDELLNANTVNLDLLSKEAKLSIKNLPEVVKLIDELISLNCKWLPMNDVIEFAYHLSVIDKKTYNLFTNHILNLDHVTYAKKMEKTDFNNLNQAILFEKDVCVIFLDISKNRIGRIVKVSPSIKNIFGYNEKDLCGCHITKLIPEPIASIHDDILENSWNSITTNSFCKSLREVYAVDKNNLICPITIKVKLESIGDDIYFAGVIQRFPGNQEILLTDNNNLITGYSKKIKERFDYSQSKMINMLIGLPITLLIPNLLIFYDNMTENSSGNKLTIFIPKKSMPNLTAKCNKLFQIQGDHESTFSNLKLMDKYYKNLLKNQEFSTYIGYVYLKKESFIVSNTVILKVIKLHGFKEISDKNLQNNALQAILDDITILKRKYVAPQIQKNPINESLASFSNVEEMTYLTPKAYRHTCQINYEFKLHSPTNNKYDKVPNFPDTISKNVQNNDSKISDLSGDFQNDILETCLKKYPQKIQQHFTFNNEEMNEVISSKTTAREKHALIRKKYDDVSPIHSSILKDIALQIKEKENSQFSDSFIDVKELFEVDNPKSETFGSSNENFDDQKHKDKHSEVSKTSSLTLNFNLYKSMLLEKKLSPTLVKLNIFGIIILMLFNLILCLIFIISFPSLNKYRLYIANTTFTRMLLADMGIFGNQIESFQIGNINLAGSPYIPDMQDVSYRMMNFSFTSYKQIVTDSFINTDLANIYLNFDLDNIEIDLWELNSTSNKYDENTSSFVILMLSMLSKMQSLSHYQPSAFISNDTNVAFFRKNFRVIFDTYTSISKTLNNEVYGENASINIKSLSDIMLAINMSLTFILLIILYPIYRKIENLKVKGLSFILTLPKLSFEEKYNKLLRYKDLLASETYLNNTFRDITYKHNKKKN